MLEGKWGKVRYAQVFLKVWGLARKHWEVLNAGINALIYITLSIGMHDKNTSSSILQSGSQEDVLPRDPEKGIKVSPRSPQASPIVSELVVTTRHGYVLFCKPTTVNSARWCWQKSSSKTGGRKACFE